MGHNTDQKSSDDEWQKPFADSPAIWIARESGSTSRSIVVRRTRNHLNDRGLAPEYRCDNASTGTVLVTVT